MWLQLTNFVWRYSKELKRFFLKGEFFLPEILISWTFVNIVITVKWYNITQKKMGSLGQDIKNSVGEGIKVVADVVSKQGEEIGDKMKSIGDAIASDSTTTNMVSLSLLFMWNCAHKDIKQNQRVFRFYESIFFIFAGRCNIRSFSQCWVPYQTRKSNRMDIIIRGNHCNCCSGESFIHNWMRMYNSHKNHRVLSSYQLIHQRYLISIVVRPLYVKFRNHCRILVR